MAVKTPSAKSKKFDQMYVSRAEIKKAKAVGRLKGIVSFTERTFQSHIKKNFGVRFWNRLVNVSKRKHKTPFFYAKTTLLN